MTFWLSILGAGRAIARWLFKDWRNLAMIVALVILGSGWWTARAIDKDRDRWRSIVSAEQAAHTGTVLNYMFAAIRAQHIAFTNRATVEARWRAQYKEAVDAKAALQLDYRARAVEWVRRQSVAPGDSGGAHGADLSETANAAGGIDDNAATAIVPVSDIQRCADLAAHLQALIQWLSYASAVETSPQAAPQ